MAREYVIGAMRNGDYKGITMEAVVGTKREAMSIVRAFKQEYDYVSLECWTRSAAPHAHIPVLNIEWSRCGNTPALLVNLPYGTDICGCVGNGTAVHDGWHKTVHTS